MVLGSFKRFPQNGSHALRAKTRPPSYRQYKPGYFQAISPLIWDEIIDADVHAENWPDPVVASGGRRCPGDGNDTNDGKDMVAMRGGEIGIRQDMEGKIGRRNVRQARIGRGWPRQWRLGIERG
jgi:hypothetical protein